MKPIKTAAANFVYKGDGGQVVDLPTERVAHVNTENEVAYVVNYSVWEPTKEERWMIAEGYNLRLGVFFAEPLPPCSITVTEDQEVS